MDSGRQVEMKVREEEKHVEKKKMVGRNAHTGIVHGRLAACAFACPTLFNDGDPDNPC